MLDTSLQCDLDGISSFSVQVWFLNGLLIKPFIEATFLFRFRQKIKKKGRPSKFQKTEPMKVEKDHFFGIRSSQDKHIFTTITRCNDLCFLLPLFTKVVLDTSVASRSYLSLQLSFRGSERQAPSILTLALTFSAVMTEKASTGQHDPSMSTEQRLKTVVTEFNDQPGLIAKWRVDSDREKAVLNLLMGTTKGTRALIQAHLDFHKWAYSAFTSELLRSSRWLVSACPRNCKESMRKTLTVTAQVQEDFIANIISWYVFQTRKVKLTSRARCRASQQEWDDLVSYSCIMNKLKEEASETLKDDPDNLSGVLDQLHQAFLNRLAYVPETPVYIPTLKNQGRKTLLILWVENSLGLSKYTNI